MSKLSVNIKCVIAASATNDINELAQRADRGLLPILIPHPGKLVIKILA